MAVQIQSLVGQYKFTGTADMYSIFSHALMKLQYTIFTRTHFATTEFQREKHFQTLLRTSGKDKHVHSSRIRKRKD
jgi:hypothetical protein